MSLPELRKDSDRVAGRVRTRLRRLERGQTSIKIGMILIGGTIATAAQFMPEPAANTVPWKAIFGVTGALSALVGGVLVAFVEQDAPAAFEEARKAIEKAREFLIQRDQIVEQVRNLRRQFTRERHLRAAFGVMREAIEQALSADMPLEETMDLMLQLSARPLTAALAFEAGDRWTLAVFRMDPATGLLTKSASLRADRSEEKKEGRAWRPGEGYAGATFSRGLEMILPDAQSPGILSVLNIPTDKRNDSDSDRYKSLAAVPVRVDGLSDPWGVVIATTDRKDHFDSTAGTDGWTRAEAVRIVSGMVALAAVTKHKLTRSQSVETGG